MERKTKYRGIKGGAEKLFPPLIARDGPCCQICNDFIDFSLSGTNADMAPSVDHVIPRSLGGTNELHNLRLAHRICNERRGNMQPPVNTSIVIRAGKHSTGPLLEMFQSYISS